MLAACGAALAIMQLLSSRRAAAAKQESATHDDATHCDAAHVHGDTAHTHVSGKRVGWSLAARADVRGAAMLHSKSASVAHIS